MNWPPHGQIAQEKIDSERDDFRPTTFAFKLHSLYTYCMIDYSVLLKNYIVDVGVKADRMQSVLANNECHKLCYFLQH